MTAAQEHKLQPRTTSIWYARAQSLPRHLLFARLELQVKQAFHDARTEPAGGRMTTNEVCSEKVSMLCTGSMRPYLVMLLKWAR